MYNKEYYESHKDDVKEYVKAWRQSHKDKVKAKNKAWYQANKDKAKADAKAYYEANKEDVKASKKAYRQSHKDELNEYAKSYKKSDVNSLGQRKDIIRSKSRSYLKKHGKKIHGYEIHHCCSYTEPYKFIYCSREMHNLIHSYLRQHNIDADSNHYDFIKHLLDESVVLYGLK